MSKKKRFSEYISYYYRFLYLFRLQPNKEHYIFVGSGVFLGLNIVLIFITSHFDGSFSSTLIFLLQTIFGFGLAVLIFTLAVWLRISVDDEKLRVDTTKFTPISDENIFEINMSARDLAVSHDISSRSSIAPFIEILLNKIEIEKDSYYRIYAGSLDIPKISLVKFDKDVGEITTGICAFQDTFFTHYSPDLHLSRSSSGENLGVNNTLRKLVGPLISEHYKDQGSDLSLAAFEGLPNPIGVTGAVRIICEESGASFWVLQKRGYSVAAQRHRLQMGYAGIIDAIPFFTADSFSFDTIIDVELNDEILGPLTTKFKTATPVEINHHVLALCFNHNYLYQPEFICCTDIVLVKASFDAIVKGQSMVDTDHLAGEIDRIERNELVFIEGLSWANEEHFAEFGFREVDVICARAIREREAVGG